MITNFFAPNLSARNPQPATPRAAVILGIIPTIPIIRNESTEKILFNQNGAYGS